MSNNENKLETKGLTLGQAIEHLNEGRMIAREGWNGKGLFVFKQIPSRVSVDVTVPKMQSLPQAVKDVFKARKTQDDTLDLITYENQLAIVNKDNVINNWSPSVSDTLANDWYVFEKDDVVGERDEVTYMDKFEVTKTVLPTQGDCETSKYIVTEGHIQVIISRPESSIPNFFDGLILDSLKQVIYTKDFHFTFQFNEFREPSTFRIRGISMTMHMPPAPLDIIQIKQFKELIKSTIRQTIY